MPMLNDAAGRSSNTKVQLDNIPLELLQCPQWVCWDYRVRYGKETKIPLQPDGRSASSTNPTTLSDDQELLQRAMLGRNGDKFRALWIGDTRAYASDHSRADLALCRYLAYWTGGDVARIDRLFRHSGLMRPKWTCHHYTDGRTYGQATIAKALDR